jgi:tRNA-2-methylthio-N6-dimethylallyladenosine synthase
VRTDGKRKHVFIRTYGCQMNVYDSDRMADVLRPLGYALAPTPEQADLVVLNTCHIREHASEKVYSELGRMRDLKLERRADGGDLTIAVRGCVAQAEGAEIARRQPAVDIVVGPQAYHRLPQLLAEAERKAAIAKSGKRCPAPACSTPAFPAESKFDHLPAPQGVRAGSAFLSIQEGCDKFCTFCVVPYTRGAEYSRPPAKVLVEGAAARGGGRDRAHAAGSERQCLSRRSRGRLDLVAGALDPRARRARGRRAHPLHDLASARHGRRPDRRATARCRSLMPYLHLPVQSGSDRILEAMNRKHGRDLFLGIVDRLRRVRPISRCRPISSSASRARAMPTSTTLCAWSSRSVSPRPSPSSTAAGPARRDRRWTTSCRRL